MLHSRPLEFEVSIGDGGGHHKGTGLDAIGNDAMLGAMQRFDALDVDLWGALPGDSRPAGVEVVGEVNDFGFAGG